jgi:hypothetical protein
MTEEIAIVLESARRREAYCIGLVAGMSRDEMEAIIGAFPAARGPVSRELVFQCRQRFVRENG